MNANTRRVEDRRVKGRHLSLDCVNTVIDFVTQAKIIIQKKLMGSWIGKIPFVYFK